MLIALERSFSLTNDVVLLKDWGRMGEDKASIMGGGVEHSGQNVPRCPTILLIT